MPVDGMIAPGSRERVHNRIFVLNGPNLNLLGEREPHIYGGTTLTEVGEICLSAGLRHHIEVDFRQTNLEGEMIDAIHEARNAADGILINPAAWTFTSVAIFDALKTFDAPKIEFHISNVHKREEIYRHSLMSPAVTAVMLGLGAKGYGIAIDALLMLIGGQPSFNRGEGQKDIVVGLHNGRTEP
jgi:3-dehydroquinate dehydratase-2